MIVANGDSKDPPVRSLQQLENLHHRPENMDQERSDISSLIHTDVRSTQSTTISGQHLENKPTWKAQKTIAAPCCSCSRQAACCSTCWQGRLICKCIVAGRKCKNCKPFHTKCKNKNQDQEEPSDLHTTQIHSPSISCILPSSYTATALTQYNHAQNMEDDNSTQTLYHKSPTSNYMILDLHKTDNNIDIITSPESVYAFSQQQDSAPVLKTADDLLREVYDSTCNDQNGTDNSASFPDDKL